MLAVLLCFFYAVSYFSTIRYIIRTSDTRNDILKHSKYLIFDLTVIGAAKEWFSYIVEMPNPVNCIKLKPSFMVHRSV